MKIAKGTICLVVDGSRMLLMINQGDADSPILNVIEHHRIVNPQDRDLAADAPGTVHESASPGRSTYEGAHFHQQNEDQFAIQAARALNRFVASSDGALIVAAPARILAILRRHYSDKVKKALLAEMDKDFTKIPVSEISERIKRFETPLQPFLSLNA